MKIMILVALICLGFTVNAQNMNSSFGKVEYKYYVDTVAAQDKLEALRLNDPKKFKNLSEQIKQINRAAENLSFSLQFDKEKALFSLNEPVLPENLVEQMAYKSAAIVSLDAKEAFFVDYANKTQSFYMDWMGSKIQVIQPFNPIEWNLSGNRKFSNGRTLIEATSTGQLPIHQQGTETVIRAWFDRNVPFPYGPAGYHGLPGLIFELYIETEEPKGFIVSDINMTNSNKKGIRLPKVMASMTEEEFEKTVENHRNK